MRYDPLPPALADAIKSNPIKPPKDKLDQLRELVAQARDIESEIEHLEEQLKIANKKSFELCHDKLPKLMDEAGLPSITLAAEGNHPEVVATASPFYAASIAAKWPEEKRRKAMEWLDNNGFGDLIKTRVEANFPRETLAKARKFAQEASKAGATTDIKESVHSGTLSAWLREQVEEKGYIPPLELIGGVIGRVVNLKVKRP
jgi:hypothetical protein